MANLQPFRGLRPPRSLVQKVACPPYDVVSAKEARLLAQGNPQSFFHISRPEIALAPETDEHAGEVYAEGLRQLRAFATQGWLALDPEPRFYVYRQVMGTHAQVGLVASASVDEYDRGDIRKHELTRQDKEDDRTRHIETLHANDEPVFLTYRASQAIDATVAEVTRLPPEYDFTAEDGVAHTFWVVPGALVSKLQGLFERVPRLYIADGHHRSAAAARVRGSLARQSLAAPGASGFLAVVFPHDQMRILPYNRLVKDLNGLSTSGFLEKVRERFEITPGQGENPARRHDFGMYLGGAWYQLRAKPGSFPETPVGALDVSILQANLLSPLLGIGDPRTDERIAFVGGIRGTGELVRRVASGEAQVAFSMFPTSLDELMAIADANEIMPPKSTWFEPKLRSGLVLHPFDA
jgi:uncharacterized protein (DUF1015 family)